MRNQMTYKRIVALTNYLTANQERLLSERPKYPVVAQQASEVLGFEVSEHNVRAAAEACGLVWLARRGSGRSSSKQVSQVLARAILDIAAYLQVPVSENVERVARKERVSEE